MTPLARVARWLGRRLQVRGVGRLLLAAYPCRADSPRSVVGNEPRSDGLLMALDSRRWIDWNVLFREYEPQVRRALEALLTPGGVAVDVGANIGVHTLTMARLVGPTGRVLAFEPNPAARAALRQNLELNGLHQVLADARALGATAETRLLRVPRLDSNEGGNSGLASLVALDTPHEQVAVEVVTLDSVIESARVSRVDAIKIDVQGFEAEVIAGAETVIARDAPALIFEIEPGAWWSGSVAPKALCARLATVHGYRFHALTAAGTLAVLPVDRVDAGHHAEILAIADRRADLLKGLARCGLLEDIGTR